MNNEEKQLPYPAVANTIEIDLPKYPEGIPYKREDLEDAYSYQYSLYEWFNKYDEVMESLLDRRRRVLKARFVKGLNALEDAKTNIDKSKLTIQKLNHEYETSPQYIQIREIKKVFEDQFDELDKTEKYLSNLCQVFREKVIKNQEELAQKKHYVCKINQKNVELSMECQKSKTKLKFLEDVINHQQQHREQNQALLKEDRSSNGNSMLDMTMESESEDIKSKYDRLLKQVNNVKKRNAKVKRQINKKSIAYQKQHDSFIDCLKFYETFLYKSQQIAQDEGLNGSLFFELIKKKKNANQMKVNQKFMFHTDSSQREVFNIVYDTMRHLVHKKEEKEKIAGEDLTLPKNTLDNFTSVQIRGILSIKPNLEKQIIDLWTEKQKQIHRVIGRSKAMKGKI